MLCFRNLFFTPFLRQGVFYHWDINLIGKLSFSDALAIKSSSPDAISSPFLYAVKEVIADICSGSKLFIFSKNKMTGTSCSVDYFKWLVLFWYYYLHNKINMESVII